jgi:hypothetical protein
MRPRNRRLISTSVEQELVSSTGTSTPNASRAVSPIPSRYPSRTTSQLGIGERPVGGILVDDVGKRVSSPVGFGGIWEGGWTPSWSALQGLASSVLGIETEGGAQGSSNGGTWGRKAKKGAIGSSPGSWGPAGLPKKPGTVIGIGSLAERDADVRVRKMRGVLEGRDEDLNVQKDTNGNYKRRKSFDSALPDGQQDEDGDALVYIHYVQPQDTLAGVILRYSCQPEVFRKANRFWPNDSIQIRKMVLVPVDACTVKGRPCDPPSADSPNQAVDLLAPTPSAEDPPHFSKRSWSQTSSTPKESAELPELEDENPWVHVRWVLIGSTPSSKPVEIARMPRKTLGYFPPRRRKSQNTFSSVSTPRASLDLPQFSHIVNDATGSPASTSSRRTSNLGPRPSQSIAGSYFPPSSMTASSRPRRESMHETADRMGWMRGPGGVGTFGKNVKMPGPANDGLNKWASKHIPGLAIGSLPSTAYLGTENANFGFRGDLGDIIDPDRAGRSATPSEGLGQSLGLENAASAIEGWVRKLAIKKPGTPSLGGRMENSDLIELLDGAGSDDGRGFEPNAGSSRTSAPTVGGSGRDDLDGMLRGRSATAAKSRKSD